MKKIYVPPLIPVNPLRAAGELNQLVLNLADLRLFIVECIKEGKEEIPLGDFCFACITFSKPKGKEEEKAL